MQPHLLRSKNSLISSLPVHEYAILAPHFELVTLRPGQVLHLAGQPLRHLYFPVDAVTSEMLLMPDGKTTELAMIGPEGVVGFEHAMDSSRSSYRVEVIGGGFAFRIGSMTLREKAKELPEVVSALRLFAHALLTYIAQTAACNRAHSVDEQVCRWLLHAADRFRSAAIPVTQQKIADALGVRREGVSGSIAKLRDEGLVESGRGTVLLLDRDGIEARACECYRVVQREYDRLFKPAQTTRVDSAQQRYCDPDREDRRWSAQRREPVLVP